MDARYLMSSKSNARKAKAQACTLKVRGAGKNKLEVAEIDKLFDQYSKKKPADLKVRRAYLVHTHTGESCPYLSQNSCCSPAIPLNHL